MSGGNNKDEGEGGQDGGFVGWVREHKGVLLGGAAALAGLGTLLCYLKRQQEEDEPLKELGVLHLALNRFESVTWHKMQAAARDVFGKWTTNHKTSTLGRSHLVAALGEVHDELAGTMPSSGDWPPHPTLEMVEEALRRLSLSRQGEEGDGLSRMEFENLVQQVRNIQAEIARQEMDAGEAGVSS